MDDNSWSSLSAKSSALFDTLGLRDAFERLEGELSRFGSLEQQSIKTILSSHIASRYFGCAVFLDPDGSIDPSMEGCPSSTCETGANPSPELTLDSSDKPLVTHSPQLRATLSNEPNLPTQYPVANFYYSSHRQLSEIASPSPTITERPILARKTPVLGTEPTTSGNPITADHVPVNTAACKKHLYAV